MEVLRGSEGEEEEEEEWEEAEEGVEVGEVEEVEEEEEEEEEELSHELQQLAEQELGETEQVFIRSWFLRENLTSLFWAGSNIRAGQTTYLA